MASENLPATFPRLQEGELLRLQSVAKQVNQHRRLKNCRKIQADLEILRVLAAVEWAAGVWRAWYLALTMRREVEHSVNDAPASSIVRRLALKRLIDEKMAVKFVKGQTTYLAAKILGQRSDELPTLNDSDGSELSITERGILGSGWVYHKCADLMRAPVNEPRISRRWREARLAVAQDILASKLGRPPITEGLVQAAEVDYQDAMTNLSRRQLADEDQARIQGLLREEVKVRIKEICHHVFHGKQFTPEYTIPSLNASYETGRKWGGAFVGLMSDWAAGVFGTDELVEPTNSEVLEYPVRIYDVGISINKRVPLKGLDYLSSFSTYVDRKILQVCERGFIEVKPFSILEPDKPRTITMEEEAVSYGCLSIQKFLHRTLKGYGPFTFIGQPLTDEGWELHFSRPLQGDEEYQSGDFDGATNNLNPDLSSYAWECICEETTGPNGLYDAGKLYTGNLLSTVWHRIGRMDLVHHRFHFGDEAALQVWGQLMGSPVSFPILCIVNLAASSCGIGMTCEEIFREDSPILVNGDDLAAICPRSRYPLWSKYVTASGLKPSLGKNYMSTHFCIMNSEGRLATQPSSGDGEGVVTWKQVTFLNQALLRGFEKKGTNAGEDLKPTMGWWQLGPRAQELCYKAPSSVSAVWLRAFIAYHDAILRTVPAGVSWYAAQAVGGVGLPHCVDIKDIPLDSLKYHSFVVSLVHNEDPMARRLFSYPSLTTKSWIDKQLSDSEKYYAKYFPSHLEETGAVASGKTGMPLPREQSSLGSGLRLAYVLGKFVEEWTRLTPGQRIAMRTGDTRVMETNHCVEYGTAQPNPKYILEVRRLEGAICRTREKAKRKVSNLVYGPRPNVPQTQLYCMCQSRLEEWITPLQRVIDWPDILSLSLTRFGIPNQSRTARHCHEQHVPTPTEQNRMIARMRLQMGRESEPHPDHMELVSWERQDVEELNGLGVDSEISVWERVALAQNPYSPTYTEVHWSGVIAKCLRFETESSHHGDDWMELLTKRREDFIQSGDLGFLSSTVRGSN